MKRFSVSPSSYIHFHALKGDASDNIPGAQGIGIKTASRLVQEYGTIDNIYKNINMLSSTLQKIPFITYRNPDLTSKVLYKDKQLTVLGRDLDKTDNMIIEPYQALRTDLTYIKYQEKFIYLGTVKDIFTREILSANLSNKHDSVLATFIAIIKAHSTTASVEKPCKFITGIPRFIASVVSIQEKKVICRQTA